jgi:hypothetical protein
MPAIHRLVGAILAGLLSSCLTVGHGRTAANEVELSRDVADLLATEFVTRLRAALLPAQTTLRMNPAAHEGLRGALEHQLRKAGFAVTASLREPGALSTDWAVCRIADRQFRVTLRAGDAFEASRAYEVDAHGQIRSLAPMTVRHDPDAPSLDATGEASGGPLCARSAPQHPRPIASSQQQRASSGAGEGTRTPDHAARIGSPASLPAQPAVARPEVSPAEPARPAPAPFQPLPDDAIVLSPDRDHVIEISAALFSPAEGEVLNPFLQQYQSKAPGHALTISIGGVVMGPHPTAVVNDRVCSIGDTIEGFRVRSIQADLVVLQWENFELRIPADPPSVTVRYP